MVEPPSTFFSRGSGRRGIAQIRLNLPQGIVLKQPIKQAVEVVEIEVANLDPSRLAGF